jgi:hypothetical protein
MVRESTEVGVIVDRQALQSPWADHAWKPVAVLAGAPAAAPWTVLAETPQATRYFAGRFELEFFGSETGMYRDNLQSGRPSLWVSLRPTDAPPGVALHLVTADPGAAVALTAPGTDVIEAVPMPPAIQQRLAAFVAAHHVERPFVKRKRDRADPEAMAMRGPGPRSKGKPR